MCSLNWCTREIRSLCRYVWEFTSSYKIHVHAYLFANQTVAHFWGFFIYFLNKQEKQTPPTPPRSTCLGQPQTTGMHTSRVHRKVSRVDPECAHVEQPPSMPFYLCVTISPHTCSLFYPGHSHMIHTWPEGQEVKKKKEKDQMRQKSSLTLVHVSSHKKQF